MGEAAEARPGPAAEAEAEGGQSGQGRGQARWGRGQLSNSAVLCPQSPPDGAPSALTWAEM